MLERHPAVVGDDDALAACEPVLLDDVRGPQGVDGVGDLLDRRADVGQARGDVGGGHDLLGERLAALQPSGLRRGPEAGDPCSADGVGDAGDEGRLGPDDDEVHAQTGREVDDAVGVADTAGERLAAGDRLDAGVARGRDDGVDGGVEGEGADERVLAGSGADDENLHATNLGGSDVSGSRVPAYWCVPSTRVAARRRFRSVTAPHPGQPEAAPDVAVEIAREQAHVDRVYAELAEGLAACRRRRGRRPREGPHLPDRRRAGRGDDRALRARRPGLRRRPPSLHDREAVRGTRLRAPGPRRGRVDLRAARRPLHRPARGARRRVRAACHRLARPGRLAPSTAPPRSTRWASSAGGCSAAAAPTSSGSRTTSWCPRHPRTSSSWATARSSRR